MTPPVIPPGAAKSLKRVLALLEEPVQLVIRHRWELDGAYFLTREQLAARLKTDIGEVRRLELQGRDDLKRILTKEHWL